MKTTEVLSRGALNDRHLTELADQMDPAIGEAASVMGAMATEMIRRSLRGGVLQIGRELNGYVGQQVELQIVEQRPLIEKTAAETATEVARGEVDAVRQASTAQAQQLATRIDETSRQAQQQIDEAARQAQRQAETVARDLGGRLEETSRQTHEKIETVAKTLDDTARQTHEKIETVAKSVDETAKQSTEATSTLAQTLQTEVAAVETRTLDAARKDYTEQIEAFKDRARQATAKIKDRLDKLDATSAELGDLQRALKQELIDSWRHEQHRLHQQMDGLRRVNEALVKRVEILERPRGLRRLWAWMFGKKPQPVADSTAAE